MASPSTCAEAQHPLRLRDVIDHDEDDDFIADEEEEDEEDWDMSKRMSRLSMEGSDGGDADDEDDGYRRGDGDKGEEEDDDEFEVRSDVNSATYSGAHLPWPPYDGQAPPSASLPGTPDRGAQSAQSAWWTGPSTKEYASETEARWLGGGKGRHRHHRRERMIREVWLERAWRMQKQRRQLQGQVGEVPVVVLGSGGESPAARGGVAMDMEEVRACRDLGLDLPCDWTVEIPCYALSGVDTASSGGNSPASGSCPISSPGG
ncbi:uncharacterized protein LOC133910386 isoform X2 [Phragmites australis]|uniref:uncharacterized protein LOC133910386 isoform X2 n=1 Tax=Phragmites australis TaxID=29695 RepID=UPI002D79B8F7|nr:uncharacterized protein LOC133910386 isoform X2 [Phragmites australis]